MIRKILVPNRGEIAVRIARTASEMGIATALAHAEDDVSVPALRIFEETISLGRGDSRQTYLDVEKIIEAARAIGADAIHPGYGFLSERAALAEACVESGIVFIGPEAKAISMMGSKAESRKLMQAAGVPVIPGYDGEEQSDERLVAEAAAIGVPLLVKASAGGGGKGMKVVRELDTLSAALDAARREALKSFGDDRLILEKYIEEPRHVELQVLGDAMGNIIHLYERDCSIQRRHQKVVEESPAPRYSESLRDAMGKAAVRAAEAVGYRNAGTVEFILTQDGEFYFLEMNTRLQVEHPVTELVLGIDLVRAQIEIAGGSPLPWKQNELRQRGHAIEVRVYAEDPANGFLPQTGTVRVYREPVGPGIRVDSGIDSGSEVGVGYDPMLAKVISHAESRGACIARLERALSELVILGTNTNAAWLRRIISHPAFEAGELSTRFIELNEESLRVGADREAVALAAALSTLRKRGSSPTGNSESRVKSVWDTIGTWGR